MPGINLLLPVGISFYTLLGLSYLIDVYRGTIKAERHAGVFSAYIALFPQVLAGPMTRPGQLIPQLREYHPVNYSNITTGFRSSWFGVFS